MAEKGHVHILGFGYSYVVQHKLIESLGSDVTLEVYVSMRTIFNVFAKDEATSERRIQIYILSLGIFYERFKLSKIG